mmetsp:Transcript_4647/g.8847  ORF Transcript_4647/g.8847 Transcript_4647/m.8847 type:complete len:226 (-) Transcript_4647:148-825(-)
MYTSSMKVSVTVLLCALATSTAFDVIRLSPDNYDELTSGKTVFIKFFAPWCGHCKKMEPDWKQLAEEWDGHEIGLVAEIDCTAEGKSLCDDNGVTGFPTLKYGNPAALDDYQGARSFVELSKFAQENLKPTCSVANIDLCDDETKKQIEEYLTMPLPDLESKVSELEATLEKAEEAFKEEVSKLQAAYERIMEEKEAKLAAARDSGLNLLRSVKIVKSMDVKDEL